MTSWTSAAQRARGGQVVLPAWVSKLDVCRASGEAGNINGKWMHISTKMQEFTSSHMGLVPPASVTSSGVKLERIWGKVQETNCQEDSWEFLGVSKGDPLQTLGGCSITRAPLAPTGTIFSCTERTELLTATTGCDTHLLTASIWLSLDDQDNSQTSRSPQWWPPRQPAQVARSPHDFSSICEQKPNRPTTFNCPKVTINYLTYINGQIIQTENQ